MLVNLRIVVSLAGIRCQLRCGLPGETFLNRACRSRQNKTSGPPTVPANPLVKDQLLLEGVFHLFAGILQAGLRLIGPAFVSGVMVSGRPADGFLGPAAQILDLVLHLVCSTHVVVTTQRRAILKPQVAVPVIMDVMGTAVVVAIVATLMLLGIGIVVNQLLRLRKWLNDSPPDTAPGEDAPHPLD
jgi:hypothetical protein